MKQTHAIEIIKNSDSLNDLDLILCGIEGIDKANHSLASALYYEHIGPQNSIKNICGLGEENKFFYSINSFLENKLIKYEFGTGYAYEQNDLIKFHRYLPVLWGKDSFESRHFYNGRPSSYVCVPGAVNILHSYSPESYLQLFFDKNCVIVSKDKFSPQSLQIKNNSVLGRLDDDVCSIPIDSLNITVNSNKQEIKNSMYYNADKDVVQFYDGIKWRSLKWAEDEKAE
jgi:hypothetical protein